MPRKENIFVIDENTVEMTVHDHKGNPKKDKVYFDLADLELVKQYRWCTNRYGKTMYALTSVRCDNKQITLLLHQFLLPASKPLSVDHIDRDGLNNRRSNLRRATRHQQAVNQGMRDDNTSGVKGVIWNKAKRKWMASIEVDRKHIYLGLFKSKEDARVARLEGERKYFKSTDETTYLQALVDAGILE